MLSAYTSSWRASALLLLLLQLTQLCFGLSLDITNDDSVKRAARVVADGMMSYYHGNESGQIIGMLPGPYYWWEAGAMWGTMVEYWYYTGDTTYNEVTVAGLQSQVGANKDYEPQNVTKQLGNDDQAFWALAAMTAAELKFQDPDDSKDPSWLALAQAVFNRQAGRWETATCNGGLRWQIFPFNSGYDYKNSISNGCFFQLASRLYRYTGNETYGEWANKIYDWMSASPLLSKDFHVFDGTAIAGNCSGADHHEWTYNVGTMMAGAAYMYNATNGSAEWKDRLTGFIQASNIFFSANGSSGPVMVEVACEPYDTCNYDQPSFKAYLSRWMAVTTQLADFSGALITSRLQASAQGAAGQCSGGATGSTCGRFWNQTQWSGHSGVGEQMSALSIIQGVLAPKRAAPVSAKTGGTSKGDPNAGTQGGSVIDQYANDPVTKGDRVGAGFLTTLMLILTASTVYFMAV